MSYEDWQCDDSFRVESSAKFIDDLNPEEEEFLLTKSGMKPCKNCGEWDNKEYLKNGTCNLCNRSEDHKRIRGGSSQANENGHTIESMVKRLEEIVRT